PGGDDSYRPQTATPNYLTPCERSTYLACVSVRLDYPSMDSLVRGNRSHESAFISNTPWRRLTWSQTTNSDKSCLICRPPSGPTTCPSSNKRWPSLALPLICARPLSWRSWRMSPPSFVTWKRLLQAPPTKVVRIWATRNPATASATKVAVQFNSPDAPTTLSMARCWAWI